MTNQAKAADYPLRPYGKTELAMAYTCGTMTERAALRWLHIEMENNPALRARLEELGYYRRQKMFTMAQVKAIFEAFGRP